MLEEKLIECSINQFLDITALGKPVPGGGSVAALSGALAASLVSMVCRVTIGKKNYQNVEEEMKNIMAKSEKLRGKLTHLIQEDVKAYSKVVQSYKSKKKYCIEASLKNAVNVPLQTAACSKALLTLADKVSNRGNRSAYSDAKAAFSLAKASIDAALETAKMNLPLIQDDDFSRAILEKIDKISS